MASKTRPYEQFGSYLLLKKLESDALGDLFRAVRIEGSTPGPVVALRRLSGGDREALATAALTAQQVVSSLSGPSFARDQRVEIVAGTAAVVHEYASGRSLRYIIDRARSGGATQNPIPLDQSIVIVERAALSLATTAELRLAGERLVHGGLIPQFIWITDDGEIRVAGQQLGKGLVAALRDEKVANEIGRYFAPETHHSGEASKSTEVYALGAILYLVVTGLEPPDATRTTAFTHAVRASKTMAGVPVPDDIRAILEKSLNIDPAGRFASPADMRAALSALSASGKYSATSFNLAFYLSNLLKKELEAEATERERESKINIAPYLENEPAAIAPSPSVASVGEMPAAKGRSKLPIAVAATFAVAAAGIGTWFVLGAKQKPAVAATPVVTANVLTPSPVSKPIAIPEPIVASPSGDAAPAAQTSTDTGTQKGLDEAAKRRMFDDAVKKRLQEEMLKLQADYTRQLQKEQARTAPMPLLSTAPPPSASVAAEERMQDQQRVETPQAEDTTTAVAQQTAVAAPPPVTATAAPQVAAQGVVPPPVAAAPVIREGDVVDIAQLDQVPRAVREPRPVYPPLAARQRMEATVMASVLISERGEVLDVKILRGEPRFGFNDSAVRALRSARYTPGVKDGKHVKTWIAQMIQFKP